MSTSLAPLQDLIAAQRSPVKGKNSHVSVVSVRVCCPMLWTMSECLRATSIEDLRPRVYMPVPHAVSILSRTFKRSCSTCTQHPLCRALYVEPATPHTLSELENPLEHSVQMWMHTQTLPGPAGLQTCTACLCRWSRM